MTPAVVDLFAGAGGLSTGASQAGLEVQLLVDNDAPSCETAARNHPGSRVLQADVAALTGQELRAAAGLTAVDPLIIIGGAPCQPFSKAAYWVDPGDEAKYRRDRASGMPAAKPEPLTAVRPDTRRTLVDEYIRLVVEADADAFVFENVPSILHPRNRIVLDGLIAVAHSAGFETRVVKGKAVDFGVAQRRERVFVLASRHRQPDEPCRTHSEDPSTGLPAPVGAGEALRHVTPTAPHEPEEVFKGRWAEHLRDIPPGWNYKYHTEWAGHPEPTFVTETRFWNFLLKLDPARPSWTLPANPGPWVGPFHWESRRLRTAEYAALQGFPVGYDFAGSRRDRIRQIGNAVPAPMAAAMIESTAATLKSVSVLAASA